MTPQRFVGREVELDRLFYLLNRARSGKGGTLLVEATVGMGKTRLLRALEERCRQNPEFEKAEFVYAACDQSSGTGNAYQPCVEILATLAKSDRKAKGKAILEFIKEIGPDWLDAIPFGRFVMAGVKTGAYFLRSDDDKHAGKSKILAVQYVNTIAKIASEHALLALIFTDAQWMDDASCQLLLRLARVAPQNRLMLIVTYRPEESEENLALHRMKTEMLKDDLADVITLSGWDEDEIRRYIEGEFGEILHPRLAEWLKELCNGEPLFVTHFLKLLEEREIIHQSEGRYVLDGEISYVSGEWKLGGALETQEIPVSTRELLDQRIRALEKEERRILEVGAVQGPRFESTVLAELVKKAEDDLLYLLRGVKEQHRIISVYAGDEDSQSEAAVYAFEPSLLQRAFYDKLDPREQTIYHRRIAAILELVLKGELKPRRRLVLEVARHHALGGNHLPAARYYYQAAQTSYYDGAFLETSDLCQRALEKVRKLPEGVPDHDRLRAEVTLLLLLASELRWRGRPELQGKLQLVSLADEAEAAAARTGDLAPIAQAKPLKGKTFIFTNNLDRAVEVMKQALEVAREAKDYLAEFVIMSDLGHQMVGARATVGADFSSGLALQYQAHELFEKHLITQTGPNSDDLNRLLFRLEGTIGVGEFDRANFEDAMTWLTRSVDGLRQLKRHHELSWVLNFLGQVYTAIGLFENAEKAIGDAIGLYKDEKESIAVRAYNLAQLGKLYLEWNRVEKAEKPLLEGWKETQATWMVAVAPLVRTHYAELLMHSNYRSRDISEAERQLVAVIEETEQTGFARSKITALSLLSRLDLMKEDIESALDHSTRAVDALHRMGTMPALREEEVLFNQYLALTAAGQREAPRFLDEAYTVLQRKAKSIKNEENRRAFTERVPVSRAIISAYDNTKKAQ